MVRSSETKFTSPAGAGLVERVWDDPILRAEHMCLYAAIALHCVKAGQNQIQISRRILMRYARIKSIATYHNCIRNLARFATLIIITLFICYVPAV
jgi:hypothetical protein